MVVIPDLRTHVRVDLESPDLIAEPEGIDHGASRHDGERRSVHLRSLDLIPDAELLPVMV